MSDFYAICPECRRSLHFERTGDDVYPCPVCGRSFSYAELGSAGNIINVAAAKLSYGNARSLFDNGKYAEAEKEFEKACEFDCNNFYAEYFRLLCGIMQINGSGSYSGAEIIISLLGDPIEMLSRACQPESVRRSFLITAFRQTYSLLTGLFDAIEKIYSGRSDAGQRVSEYMTLARAVKKVTLIDYNDGMLADKEIGELAVSVCDIAMHALSRVVTVKISDFDLHIPETSLRDECRALFAAYSIFVRKIVPEYVFPHYKENFAEVESFFAKADESIATYRRISSYDNSYTDVKSDELSDMLHSCRTAFTFSYYTLFYGLGVRLSGKDSVSLMLKAVGYALEAMKPRIYDDGNGDKTIEIGSLSEAKTASENLCTVIAELKVSDVSGLVGVLEKFYDELCAVIHTHYGSIQAKIDASLEYIRMTKNKRYFYYRNFLYGIVCSAIPAFNEIIPVGEYRIASRNRLLRYCKTAADSLLFMFDYRSNEIEKQPKYSDLTTIYAYLNTNIKSLE